MAAHGDPRGGGQAQIDGCKAGRQTSPEGKPDEGDEPAVRQKRAECASSAEDRGKDQKYHENCPPKPARTIAHYPASGRVRRAVEAPHLHAVDRERRQLRRITYPLRLEAGKPASRTEGRSRRDLLAPEASVKKGIRGYQASNDARAVGSASDPKMDPYSCLVLLREEGAFSRGVRVPIARGSHSSMASVPKRGTAVFTRGYLMTCTVCVQAKADAVFGQGPPSL